MNKIIVTGGAGFIGSHTCLQLLENGNDVYVLDSFVTSSKNSIKKVIQILENKIENVKKKLHIVKCDLRNKNDIDDFFKKCLSDKKQIDAVIHLAGLKSVSESSANALRYWEFNLLGTINLLSIMKKYECKTIVFSSSATIYKSNENSLIKENQKLHPINPYGMTKLAIEKLLNDIYTSDRENWRIANLRYFNPVGAHNSGLLGEDPLYTPNNIFPLITRVAIGEIKLINIFGRDWPTKDGTGVRDYIHVMDVAEGHVRTLKYLLDRKPQILSLNIGTGIGTSVLELINVFEEVNKVKIPYIFAERRQGDNAFVVADNSLARTLLNWEPKLSISDMCKDGWKWQIRNIR